MNQGEFLVGRSLTYVDVLLAHLITWYVEEIGTDILDGSPLLLQLQIKIMSLPSVKSFIKSNQYYALGDANYCTQVDTVLGRA